MTRLRDAENNGIPSQYTVFKRARTFTRQLFIYNGNNKTTLRFVVCIDSIQQMHNASRSGWINLLHRLSRSSTGNNNVTNKQLESQIEPFVGRPKTEQDWLSTGPDQGSVHLGAPSQHS